MVKKFGRIGNVPVVILEKSTKCEIKRGTIKRGNVCVQSLISGDTGVVKKTQIKNISTKYPKLKR